MFNKNKKETQKEKREEKRIPVREIEKFFEEDNPLKGKTYTYTLKESKK